MTEISARETHSQDGKSGDRSRHANAWVPVSADELIRDAVQACGLSDFGDPSYRIGLEVLLCDFETTARFSDAGAAMARAMLVDLLIKRLHAQARLNEHGSAAAIRSPWIIVSMPRSGTTALHRILCSDPDSQGIDYWLGQYPQPRPPREQWPQNADFRKVTRELELRRAAAPNVFDQHDMRADLVDECGLVFNQHFSNMSFFALATAPNYAEWLWKCDMTGAYAWHRAMLGLIGGQSGQRWVLKDPSHMMSLDAMLQAYPDLKVICTRRSALKFLPSVSSLVYEARVGFEPETSRETVATEALGTWSRAAHALERWQADNPQIPWFDLDLADLRADPVGACKAIYDRFDEPFCPRTETAIRAALGKGIHAGSTLERQTLELYGLDEEAIRSAFPAEFTK